jgi:hypothetical protein
MTKTYPKIQNWKEVTEQFGLLTPKKGYKNAQQISKHLTDAVNKFSFEKMAIDEVKHIESGVIAHKGDDKESQSVITIEYQVDNIDSGICLFQYNGIIDGVKNFTYTGTAK